MYIHIMRLGPKIISIYRLVPGFFFILFASFIARSITSFRPVADDFCFASSASSGFFGAEKYWFMNATGDFTVTTFNLLFVGEPQFLTASSLVLLFPLFAGLLSLYLLTSLRPRSDRNEGVGPIIHLQRFGMLAVSWFVYIAFFPALFSFFSRTIQHLTHSESATLVLLDGHLQNNANSFLLWGVVTSSYLLPTCLMIYFLKLVFSFETRSIFQIGKYILIFAIGFVIGGSGYVIALTAFLYILVEESLLLIRNKMFFKNSWNKFACSAGICIGVAVSFMATGTRLRRDVLLSNFPNLKNQIFHLPIDYLRLFVEVILNPGIIFVFLLGLTSARIWIIQGIKIGNARAFLTLVRRLSFIFFAIIPIGEMLSYKAFWHKAPIQITLFLYFFTFGYHYGEKQVRSRGSLYISPILVIVVVLSLTYCGKQIDDWKIQSNTGKDLGGLSGYQNSAWIQDCREHLISSRKNL